MRSALTILALALVGLFGATSIGYAAYIVSRDSVGSPVTKLKLSPNELAPTPAERRAAKAARTKIRIIATTTRTTTTPRTTTNDDGDDHGGRSENSGKGSSGSGGGDDDDDDD